jgi:hypothetical protein
MNLMSRALAVDNFFNQAVEWRIDFSQASSCDRRHSRRRVVELRRLPLVNAGFIAALDCLRIVLLCSDDPPRNSRFGHCLTARCRTCARDRRQRCVPEGLLGLPSQRIARCVVGSDRQGRTIGCRGAATSAQIGRLRIEAGDRRAKARIERLFGKACPRIKSEDMPLRNTGSDRAAFSKQSRGTGCSEKPQRLNLELASARPTIFSLQRR